MMLYIGLVLWAVSLIVLIMVSENIKRRKFVIPLLIIALTLGTILITEDSKVKEENKIQESLVKEVNLQQVMVKGQNSFRAEIQIIYKDGKLDRVILVPKTTRPEAEAK